MPARSIRDLDRVLEIRFSTSYMSDSKWRKLMEALRTPQLDIRQVIWRFVYGESEVRASLGRGYLTTGEDAVETGPFFYKEVEWIEVPRKCIPSGDEHLPYRHSHQDTDTAARAVSALGAFEMEATETGLRIYGYK